MTQPSAMGTTTTTTTTTATTLHPHAAAALATPAAASAVAATPYGRGSSAAIGTVPPSAGGGIGSAHCTRAAPYSACGSASASALASASSAALRRARSRTVDEDMPPTPEMSSPPRLASPPRSLASCTGGGGTTAAGASMGMGMGTPPPPPPPLPAAAAAAAAGGTGGGAHAAASRRGRGSGDDNLFPLMAPLSDEELQAAPSYLTSQLGFDARRVNGCIEALNDKVTDKRFLREGGDHLTFDEVTQLLRLGGKTKTFVLLLVHLGKLRSLDSGRGAAEQPGAARYRIV